MSGHGHDEEPLIRTVGYFADEGGDFSVWVDHLYTMETCEHGHPEAGLVGLAIDRDDQKMNIVLTPEEALMLANRLERAVNLVMETGEDLPNPEREYRRHTGGDGGH